MMEIETKHQNTIRQEIKDLENSNLPEAEKRMLLDFQKERLALWVSLRRREQRYRQAIERGEATPWVHLEP